MPNRMVYKLLYDNNMMNEKQIDNISKLCYDMCKIMVSLTVVGNILSDEISIKTIWIGSIIALICLISGFLLDRLEVNQNVKD